MGTVLEGLRALFASVSHRPAARGRPAAGAVFHEKYRQFQILLESNTALLKICSEMEHMQTGNAVFGMGCLRSRAKQAVAQTVRMIKSYERLSGSPQPALLALTERLSTAIRAAMACRTQPHRRSLVLDLGDLTGDMADTVGGKCANLGEIANRVGLPVPAGFAVTTTAFRLFFEQTGLVGAIRKRLADIDPDDPAALSAEARDIQAAIVAATLPHAVIQGIRAAAARIASDRDIPVRFAVRSSAIGEDGEHSFAGQYLTLLSVPPGGLENAYRRVIASLYTPRAMAYRLLQGIPDDDLAMAVACLVQVPSQAAGVLYTRLPETPRGNELVINSVRGLGAYAVDGVVTPDTLRLDRESLRVTFRETADQPRMLALSPDGDPVDAPVPEARRRAPSLTDDQARKLAAWGLALESHYGRPQDIEWTIDPSGAAYVLQTRPLAVQQSPQPPPAPPAPGARVLATGGQSACSGVGAGPVHLVRSEADLDTFPPSAVLVAPHSAPQFMVVMGRAAAIVTEHGSVTGHMASLTREFGVPSLLGLPGATRLLPQGETVTVDATSGHVYRGKIDGLVSEGDRCPMCMAGTHVHAILRRVAACILPLHLLDPKAPNFTPAGCSSLHDITRLLHEWSYDAMFAVSDLAAGQGGVTATLQAPTGLDLRLIDLSGGLRPEAADTPTVTPDDIASRPFGALLAGLTLAGRDTAPRPVSLRGFLSVVSEQMLARPQAGRERFGEKSYAVIAEKYCNFSSRIGYHYSVLDCYCGETVNKNYITFTFAGGAADDVKRARRARAIARILSRLGFTVDAVADRVSGRFQKFPSAVIADRLTELGRLLQFTRQTDMLMVREESVDLMVDGFLAGAASFDPAAWAQTPPDDAGDSSPPRA